jgi:hypothetical protein
MTAGQQHAAGRLDRALAGLQASVIGVLTMLLWLGVCSIGRRQDFWTGPDTLAAAFRPSDAFHTGAWTTAFGVSLYILLYGVLGTLFALAAGRPMSRLRLALLAVAFSLGWYWIADHWLWRAVPPLGALLQGGRAVIWGHLLYGSMLGRFPRCLPAAAIAAENTPPVAEETAEVNSATPAD